MLNDLNIIIVGAGPTGLGAAHRLNELGYSNFVLYEKESHAGGLASSFVDPRGFTWEVGGHVQFSHYKYFDDLMDSLLGDEWLHHQRESWIWMRDVFAPYPLQNNIRRLPKEVMLDCLKGLIHTAVHSNGTKHTNFEEWIQGQFGDGLAGHFLIPYNFKVWAYPPRELAFQWVGERVAKVDLERVILNILEEKDDVSWGPNNTFRYPLRGGTGEIWRRLAQRLPASRVRFDKDLVCINSAKRTLYFADGSTQKYDILISTIPLDILVNRSDLDHLKPIASRLRYSTVHVVGIGLEGMPPPHLKTKCWMYFPEDSSPFYRATLLSNYSPNNVPDCSRYWSLMVEVSESPAKYVNRAGLIDSVISGLLATRLIRSRQEVVDTWQYTAAHGYPTPSLERDSIIDAVLPQLEERDIFSRGRFGAWKYEVSNQDHSLMQGVELIDRLVSGAEECTLLRPGFVNSRRNG